MALYVIRTTRIDEIKQRPGGFSSESYLINFDKTPELSVDVNNLKDLIAAFANFAKSLEGCGVCYRLSVGKHRQEPARKFSGFDRAAARGGPLSAIVNREVAVAAARSEAPTHPAAATC